MDAQSWLILIHQLPPKPDYLRAKIGRRLARIGAVTIKNTVYILPSGEQTLEDLQWTAGEIRAGGGEANIVEARLADGLTDGDIQQRFNEARDADYAPLIDEARAALKKRRDRNAAALALAGRAAIIERVDFFGAPGGRVLAALLDGLRDKPGRRPVPRRELLHKVWVTRAGVHIDRVASAWLIRRFIDPDARFRFVSGKHQPAASGQIRFDMADAEFTHDGERCTFEVLVDALHPEDRALRAIAEIVHDIDLKEDPRRRPESDGVAALIDGIVLAHSNDLVRIDRASAVLDDLYAWFQRQA